MEKRPFIKLDSRGASSAVGVILIVAVVVVLAATVGSYVLHKSDSVFHTKGLDFNPHSVTIPSPT